MTKDMQGRVYEYFLGKFASAEGKGGGEFYTPTSVVKTLVEMIEPYQGRIYDPCCGERAIIMICTEDIDKSRVLKFYPKKIFNDFRKIHIRQVKFYN